MQQRPSRRGAVALAIATLLLLGLPVSGMAQYDATLDALPDFAHFTTPTYDSSGSAVHPDIAYFRDGLNGYKFYMAITPAYLTDDVENPSLLVSNNGVDWAEPISGLNPLVGPPPGDHNDDADVFWDEDSKQFFIHYLQTRRDATPQFQNLVRLWSDSTVEEWDSVTAVHYSIEDPSCDDFILSPALVKKHNVYYLYFVRMPYGACGGSYSIDYMTSADGVTWNEAITRPITANIPAGVTPWHLDVFDGRDGWFYMLMTRYQNGYPLYVARSADMQNWDFVEDPILTNDTLVFPDSTFVPEFVYRSTGVVNSSMDMMYVWFSFKVLGSPSDIWRIAGKRYTLSDLFPQTTLHVPSQYATIQAAINAANEGDTVLVAPGTYTLTSSITFGGKSVVLKSSGGPQVTTITTDSSLLDLVVFDGNKTPTVLEGFTLQGGNKAVWCQTSAPTIRGNVIRDQNITNWAAVVLSGSNGEYPGASPATIVNNTITHSANGGISSFATIPAVIKNNIITDCQYGIHNEGNMGTLPPVLSYNDVWDCVDSLYYNCEDIGPGAFSRDPKFTSHYALYAGSPCIDSGDGGSYYFDPDGTRNDMGALPTWQVGSGMAYTEIQSAIDDVRTHDVVLVHPGTYTLSSSIDYAGKDIVLESFDYWDRATITANSTSLDLVVFDNGETTDAELRNFRLEGGRIAVWCKVSSPTIRGNLMVNQHITNWAAVVLAGSSWASAGSSPAVLINNTITNSANGGISSFSTTAATIMNTIITGCTYGIHNQGNMGTVAPILSYNDVWNCSRALYYNCPNTGTGTISSNPQFDNDFLLTSISPCIDAGNPGSTYNDPDNSRNDMGWMPYVGSPKAGNPIAGLPDGFLLEQNYPNPFNPTTTIAFTLPTPGHVELTVYDVLGRTVSTLANREYDAGLHTVEWNGTNGEGAPVASGVYFYRVTVGDTRESRKMLLLK